MSVEFSHVPVMPGEVTEGLNIKKGGIYVDGTLGGAGHSSLIVQKGGKVIGIDRDEAAIQAARQRLFGNVTFVNDNFNNINEILRNLLIEKIDGALLDLGVSSHQLDTPERGFSYRYDAPLDMRMDKSARISAKTIVNEYDISAIERILFEYGEEPYAKVIARKIGERRALREIETTFELVDIIKSAMPPKVRREGKHPAKRSFQAIRIAVNDELSQLSEAIKSFCNVLNPGGRFVIITFHSLEDRIVKTGFAALSSGCTCPKDFPVCVCNNKPVARLITRKPVLPSESELASNPRSASAKLRILEKI